MQPISSALQKSETAPYSRQAITPLAATSDFSGTLVAPNQEGTVSERPTETNVSSVAVNWAKKYYLTVNTHNQQTQSLIPAPSNLLESQGNRARTVDKLADTLKVASEIAWSKVRTLLGIEIERHAISPDLINSTQIIADTRNLYRKVLDAYGDREAPSRLSVLVGKDIMEIRKKYSHADPLVLGLVALEFHYVGQFLLGCLSQDEQLQVVAYLKIVDDYLHIPFGDIHASAANQDPNSQALLAVQHLLSCTTQIATAVYERVSAKNAGYRSSSGFLSDVRVKLSSIRDVEIFQSYLCLCALEGSIWPVQQELFPICVMLYPRLHVSWKVVQDMLMVLFWEMHDRLTAEDMMVFLPYLRTLTEMFSDEVFQS